MARDARLDHCVRTILSLGGDYPGSSHAIITSRCLGRRPRSWNKTSAVFLSFISLFKKFSLFLTGRVCEILPKKHTLKKYSKHKTRDSKKVMVWGQESERAFSFRIFWPINSHSSPLSIYFTLFSSLYTQLLLWLCNKLIITHFTGTCGPHHNDPC